MAEAQAAIAAYTAYWRVLDQAGADPGQDWSALVATVSTGPEMDGVLEYLKQTAARGQRVTGSTKFEPTVTKVDPGVVEMTVCVDKTYTDFLNARWWFHQSSQCPRVIFPACLERPSRPVWR